MNSLTESATAIIRNGAKKFFEALPYQSKIKLFDTYASFLKRVNGTYLSEVKFLMKTIAENGGRNAKNSTTSEQIDRVIAAQIRLLKINTKTELISEELAELISIKSKYCGLQPT